MDSSFSAESLRLFHGACKRNVLADIEPFVEQGYPINSHADSTFGEFFAGYTPLHFAVKNRDRDTVAYLLINGADILEKNNNGWSPVHLAYYIGAYNLVFAIFKHSTSLKTFANVVDRTGLAHFHICCALDVPVVDKFISNGVNVNCSVSLLAENNGGFTPLHFAVRNGSSSAIKLLFENYANPDVKCGNGLTPLLIASQYSDYSTVAFVLSFNADLKAKDNKGRTALHYAVERKNVKIVKLLVDNGASVHEPDDEKKSPFDLAVESSQYEVVDAMLSRCENENGKPVSFSDVFGVAAYRNACLQGSAKDIGVFLKHGFSVNNHGGANFRKEFRGCTPLQFAVRNLNKDAMLCLLEHGADITEQDENGWTPVHQAFYKTDESLIPVIFEHSKINTYVNVADETGLTHFHICCALNHPNISLRDFVKSGADVNCSTSLSNSSHSGYTPLHFAVARGHTDLVKWLLENGADHSSKCKGGSTPLHLACERDAEDSARLLANFGADFMARDSKNRLPLHCAFYRNPKSWLVDFLLERVRTDRNYADSQRLSVLHMASARHKIDIVKRLLDRGCCPNGRIVAMDNSYKRLLDNLLDDVDKILLMGDLAGLTPLHMALLVKNLEIVKQLILAGADINAEDDRGYSTLSYFYNPSTSICSRKLTDNVPDNTTLSGYNLEIDVIIANHIKKLCTAGLYVSASAKQEFYGRNIRGARPRSIIQQIIDDRMCTAELERLRRAKVNECTDGILRSILGKSDREMSWIVRNESLASYSNPAYLENFFKEFPLYGFMVKAQLDKGRRRLAMIENAKASLTCLTGIRVPELCSELIFKHLRNEHLENLIDANVDSRQKDNCLVTDESLLSKAKKHKPNA